jgi:hypothetical protein
LGFIVWWRKKIIYLQTRSEVTEKIYVLKAEFGFPAGARGFAIFHIIQADSVTLRASYSIDTKSTSLKSRRARREADL